MNIRTFYQTLHKLNFALVLTKDLVYFGLHNKIIVHSKLLIRYQAVKAMTVFGQRLENLDIVTFANAVGFASLF